MPVRIAGMIRIPTFFIAVVFLAPLQALAWSSLGHRLVDEDLAQLIVALQFHLPARQFLAVGRLILGRAEHH